MRLITAAAALFWVWGAILMLSGFAVGIPTYVRDDSLGPLITLVGWGAAHVFGGFALLRRKRGARWWTAALCIVSALVLFLMQVRMAYLGFALNGVALLLIAMSWRALAPAPDANPPLQPKTESEE